MAEKETGKKREKNRRINKIQIQFVNVIPQVPFEPELLFKS